MLELKPLMPSCHATSRSQDLEITEVVIRRDFIYTCSICPNKQIVKCKIMNIFLWISLNIRFGCSKEPSH